MKKIVIICCILIASISLMATIHVVDQSGQGDFTTISDAIDEINSSEQGTTHYIEVHATIGRETTYNEQVYIPSGYVISLYVNSEDDGLVIIDTGNLGIASGDTAIFVAADSGHECGEKVVIDGFKIIRGSYHPDQEEENGIVINSRNTVISNCVFGSRIDRENFNKSIYYFNNYEKNPDGMITIGGNELDQACIVGQYPIYCTGSADEINNYSYAAYIYNNNVIDCGNGIFVEDAKSLEAKSNIIRNDIFVNTISTGLDLKINISGESYSEIADNIVDNTHNGILLSSVNPTLIRNNILKNQTVGIIANGALVDKNLIHTYKDSEDVTAFVNYGSEFRNNTLICTENNNSTATSTAITNHADFSGELINNILYGFDYNVENHGDSFIFNYSCIDGSIAGFEPTTDDFNIYNVDPLFSSLDPLGNDFCDLTESSPCLDKGDPYSYANNAIPDFSYNSMDPDKTFIDMGYKYLPHDGYSRIFSPGIHWVSFPVLNEQHPDATFATSFEQAYYENNYQGLFQTSANSYPTIDGLELVEGKRINADAMSIAPEWGNFWGNDENFYNKLFRHEGYIIVIDTTDPTINDTPFTTTGTLLAEDYTFTNEMDMDVGEYHWLGYWLMEPTNIVDAFADLWDQVEKVKSQEWYYDRQSGIRNSGSEPKPSQETRNKVLEYGKTYKVWFYGNPAITDPIAGFQWGYTASPAIPIKKRVPTNFTYQEKADYEAIDLLNIPAEVQEIGVFENEICLGAVVVQDSAEQVLVYSEAANRDAGNFTFEFYSGTRATEKINRYEVLNQHSGKYENRALTAGRNEYSVVRFQPISAEEQAEDTPLQIELFNNYPNPFNPTTTISFNLPTAQEINLEIYNIKGQKVKTIYSGTAEQGRHSMVWSGVDSSNKAVGSGVYFYQLQTAEKTYHRKMLLMK